MRLSVGGGAFPAKAVVGAGQEVAGKGEQASNVSERDTGKETGQGGRGQDH